MLVTIVAALLGIGQSAPSVTLPDEHGESHTVPRQGQPLLVVYEDQEGGKQNKDGKAIISAWHTPEANRAKIDVWPIADLSKWNFWPARSPALKQVVASAAKSNSHILVDWRAVGQRAFGFQRGKNSILLVGADGRVLYASEGDTTPAQRSALEQLLRSLGLDAPR